MSRKVEEWIGKNDDEPVPPRVRLRVFDRFGGICCECGAKIAAGRRWVCDHRQALVNGGANRESNLGPIHEACDKTKTAADVAEKSKNARVRSKHLGLRKRKGPPMPGSRNSRYKRKVGGGFETR
jgi:5-methylcytosine-specific restriction endonuclease McrA